MRGPKRSIEMLTGEIEPVSFRDLENRVNVIRSRNKLHSRYTVEDDLQSLNRTEQYIQNREPSDLETDKLSTNFYPRQPEINLIRTNTKSFSRASKPIVRKSVQFTTV